MLGAKKLRGSVLAVLGATAIALAGVAPANAANEQVVRLAGNDRIETAIAISQNNYPPSGSASAVVLVNSLVPADSLVGGPLAYRTSSPILVTPPAALDSRTEQEIARVLPKDSVVYLVGGPAAVSNNVETRLKNIGYRTTRFAGRDRFETSVFVAQGMVTNNQFFVANGQTFTDALIAGSAAANTSAAVLLSNGSTLTPQVRDYETTQSDKTRYAIGSPAAQADPGATAITGTDQYDLAAKVAVQFYGDASAAGIASGVNFPDAMAGAPHAKRAGGPILLTDPNQLSEPTRAYLKSHANTINLAFIYGGPSAVSTSVDPQVMQAIQDT